MVQCLSSEKMSTANGHQIIPEVFCISHSANNRGKGMNSVMISAAMYK